MSRDGDGTAAAASPWASSDPRTSFQQVLRLQGRIRRTLLEFRAELESPAIREIVRTLEVDQGSRVAAPLAALRNVLEEALDAADTSCRDVSMELERLSGDGAGAVGDERLPPALARFVADRASTSGFDYRTERDPLRGWVVRWREQLADGSIRASGLLYEKPHAWNQD